MSRLKYFFAKIMLFIATKKSLELQSSFGNGYCLSESPLLRSDITGPRMCLAECSNNAQCTTINYIKHYLRCTFLSGDSNVRSDFDPDQTCIHYRSTPQQVNASNQCGPCPKYWTCVYLRSGETYCVRTECPTPAAIHGVAAPGTFEVGVTRYINCDTDYEFPDGSVTTSVVCLSDGSWNKALPLICKLQECPEPVNPSNGIIVAGNKTIGSFREVQCNPGYVMVGGEANIECKSGKIWTTWSGTCSSCSTPPSIPNAVVSPGEITVGSQRSYSCNTDYVDNGEPNNITCQSNAQWSATTFTCKLDECPEPLFPPNGKILSGSNTVGSLRDVQCDPGYAKIGGESNIECQSGKIWTNWTGTCSSCSEPPAIPNAVVSVGGVTIGSQRNYSCQADALGNGDPNTITCQSDAQWSTTSFTCNVIDCGTPTEVPRTTRSYSNTIMNSVATYACEYGANSNGGTTSSTCSSSGSWTSVTLHCTRQSSATFNFEGNDSYVFQQTGASFSWTKGTGSTSSLNTGPTGAYSGSYYMYFESSSPTVNGSKAAMQTKMWFSNLARCVDFYYSMYGVDVGTLSVKYMYEGSTSKYLLWSRTGNKGSASWYNAKVPINLSQDFKLIFEATDGGVNYYGDIAVDYIQVNTTTC